MPIDRRVRYTKMVLRESLIGLMKERPISRISIKAICEEADVNRATYYSHYRDQYDQLDQIEREFVDEINAYLDGLTSAADSLAVVESILKYVMENRALCCVLLSPTGDIGFENKVAQIIRERVFAVWKISQVPSNSIDDYIYTYTIAGCVGVVKKWLYDESDQLTPHDVAALIQDLNEKGANQSLT